MTQTNRPLAAAGVIFASMSLMALVDSYFFKIAASAGLWQFHLLRAAIALPLMIVISKLTGISLIPRKPGPVVLRAMSISGSMVCYFGSLAFLSVPQAAAGLFTAPVWVLVLTTFVVRGRIGPRRIAAVALGFLGVFLVLAPLKGMGDTPGLAFLMPVAGGFLYALGGVATRVWCSGESAMSMLATFFVLMILWGGGGIVVLSACAPDAPTGSSGFLLRAWGPIGGDVAFWIIAQALTALVAIYGLTRAYQLAEASFAAIFEYSFLVFASFWGVILFADIPSGREVLGILAILGSGLLIALSPAARAQTHV